MQDTQEDNGWTNRKGAESKQTERCKNLQKKNRTNETTKRNLHKKMKQIKLAVSKQMEHCKNPHK